MMERGKEAQPGTGRADVLSAQASYYSDRRSGEFETAGLYSSAPPQLPLCPQFKEQVVLEIKRWNKLIDVNHLTQICLWNTHWLALFLLWLIFQLNEWKKKKKSQEGSLSKCLPPLG